MNGAQNISMINPREDGANTIRNSDYGFDSDEEEKEPNPNRAQNRNPKFQFQKPPNQAN